MENTTTLLWQNLTANKVFISDLGHTPIASVNDLNVPVGRYAVWSPVKNSSSHQVIEVSDDLHYLQTKYHVANELLLTLVCKGGTVNG